MQQQTIGRYQVLEEIASGGQGTVFRAWDSANGTVVALKLLHPHLASDSTILDRFHREAQLAAAVSHPNITAIYEVGQDGNSHFIAMELLPDSIHNLIQSAGELPIERAVDICHQAAVALEAAHQGGIIHRDIKPQNLLLAPDGTVKVTDFGIARATELTTMTRTGALMGTPHYMSPEQTQGERVDIRSDIYSLGIVLYQMLTGQLPFEANTPFEVMRQHVDQRPETVRRLRSDIPRAVERIVSRCLEKDPEGRYATPGELARALQEAAPAAVRAESRRQAPVAVPVQPSPIHPVDPGQRERRPRRRRRSSLGSLTRTWRGSRRTRWRWVVATLAVVVVAIAIGISAGGNDLVSDLITDAGMVAAAPEPTPSFEPISVAQGSASGEAVANIPSQGTDSTPPAEVLNPTPVPMVANIDPTATMVTDLTPVPSPSPTPNPTPTAEPTPVNPTDPPSPTDSPVQPTPTAPPPTAMPPPTPAPQQGTRINVPPAFDAGQRHVRLISSDASPGTLVGLPITATDPDGDRLNTHLRFRTRGDGDTLFEAFEYHKNSNGGWVEVKQGSTLDYSARSSYEFRVAVYDGKDDNGQPDLTDAKPTTDRSWVDAYFEITINVANPDYVTWDIGEDVSVSDVETARETGDIILDYLMTVGLPKTTDLTCHIYQNRDAMAKAYAGDTGQWNEDIVSTSWGVDVYVHSGNSWGGSSSKNLSAIVAEEITGIFTDNLSEVSPNLLPAWYRAGSSWFLARQALEEAGVISYDDERWSTWVPNSSRIDKSLKDLESWRAFRDVSSEVSSSPYQYSMLAVELLASQTSQTALVDFFSSTRQNKSWRVPFNETFGMTVDEFYRLFDEHREAGFPTLEVPK